MERGLLFSIHLLTASGAALAVFAAMAIYTQDWRMAFAWLGFATIIDGIDGPLARKFEVATKLPHWDGSALDFVIDYTTYVFLPAIILVLGCGLTGAAAALAGALVAMSGALYFADSGMKLPDNSFRGFPAGWNMAVFFIFVLQPPPVLTIALVIVLAITSFLPIHFVHPVRVVRWRQLTLIVTFVWVAVALYIIAMNFTISPVVKVLLFCASLYLFTVGAVQQFLSKNRA